jgi:CRISPR system Cascade subunit CasE
MYLSQLILNWKGPNVWRDLKAPYEMHRTVMQAFPDNLPKGRERVLFRTETRPRGQPPRVLVQSRTLPDWSFLERREGYLLAAGKPNPEVKEFEVNLSEGDVLSFRMRANPTFRNHDGRRVGIYGEDDLYAWLGRKGEGAGFDVLQAEMTQKQMIRDPYRRMYLWCIQFDGILKVDDPELLAKAVQAGIGSAKGFGFGLLSLARAG